MIGTNAGADCRTDRGGGVLKAGPRRNATVISPSADAFKSRVQALNVCADALVNANSVRINTLAVGAHLPTMYPTRSPFVDAGGLMAYGPNNADLFRRAANYVDKILRGLNLATCRSSSHGEGLGHSVDEKPGICFSNDWVDGKTKWLVGHDETYLCDSYTP